MFCLKTKNYGLYSKDLKSMLRIRMTVKNQLKKCAENINILSKINNFIEIDPLVKCNSILFKNLAFPLF